MINAAFITFESDVTESIRGFHEIEFTSHHIVFRMSETDRNKIIAIRADLVFELITEVE